MPRSGSTLHYQLISAIYECAGLGKGYGFAKIELLDLPEVAVVKSEECKDWMLEAVENKQARAVGIYRDFRDIIVSLRDFYNRRAEFRNTREVWSAQEIIDREAQRILTDYYKWEKVCHYWSDYRFVINNTVAEIKQLCNYFDITLDTTEARKIARRFSLERNIVTTDNLDAWMKPDETMLTKAHISSYCGKSRWQDELSPDEIVQIEAMAGEWLIKHGYNLESGININEPSAASYG